MQKRREELTKEMDEKKAERKVSCFCKLLFVITFLTNLLCVIFRLKKKPTERKMRMPDRRRKRRKKRKRTTSKQSSLKSLKRKKRRRRKMTKRKKMQPTESKMIFLMFTIKTPTTWPWCR